MCGTRVGDEGRAGSGPQGEKIPDLLFRAFQSGWLDVHGVHRLRQVENDDERRGVFRERRDLPVPSRTRHPQWGGDGGRGHEGDRTKPEAVALIRTLHETGSELYATEGTAALVDGLGLPVRQVPKRLDEGHPNVVDIIQDGTVRAVINTL